MRKSVVSAAVLALAAGVASADRINYAVSSLNWHGAASPRAGEIITGFESSDGYTAGSINGQNGWATLATNGNGAIVDTSRAFAGTQSYGAIKNPAAGLGAFTGALHDAGGAGLTTTSAKVFIPTDAYADYFFSGTDNAGAFAWGVRFSFTGQVERQNNGTDLAPIVYNQWVDLVTTYDSSTGILTINYNGAPIYNGPSGFTNLVYDKVFIGSDNFHDPGEIGSFDNLVAVPAPGALALLGLGGILAARRRR